MEGRPAIRSRDLRVLQLADAGWRPPRIARETGLPIDVVETILAADAKEAPSPVGRRA